MREIANDELGPAMDGIEEMLDAKYAIDANGVKQAPDFFMGNAIRLGPVVTAGKPSEKIEIVAEDKIGISMLITGETMFVPEGESAQPVQVVVYLNDPVGLIGDVVPEMLSVLMSAEAIGRTLQVMTDELTKDRVLGRAPAMIVMAQKSALMNNPDERV